MNYCVFQIHVCMMANVWRLFEATSVFARMDSEGLTAKISIRVTQTLASTEEHVKILMVPPDANAIRGIMENIAMKRIFVT